MVRPFSLYHHRRDHQDAAGIPLQFEKQKNSSKILPTDPWTKRRASGTVRIDANTPAAAEVAADEECCVRDSQFGIHLNPISNWSTTSALSFNRAPTKLQSTPFLFQSYSKTNINFICCFITGRRRPETGGWPEGWCGPSLSIMISSLPHCPLHLAVYFFFYPDRQSVSWIRSSNCPERLGHQADENQIRQRRIRINLLILPCTHRIFFKIKIINDHI